MTTMTDQRSGLLMDRIYRHQRHIYNVTRKFYLLGRDRLIRDLKPEADDAVLEIGCGTARNLIKAAERYPEARCFGVDISREMIATAESSIQSRKLGGRISLAIGDATNFDGAAILGQPVFERIFISYSLSMIPSWRATLERAMHALAPGGKLLLADFGDFAGWPVWFQTAMRRWLAIFHVMPRHDLIEEAAGLASERGFSITSSRLYRGYALYITIERPSRSQTP